MWGGGKGSSEFTDVCVCACVCLRVLCAYKSNTKEVNKSVF